MPDMDSLKRVYDSTKGRCIGILLSNIGRSGHGFGRLLIKNEPEGDLTIGTLLIGSDTEGSSGNMKGFLKKTCKETGQQFALFKPHQEKIAYLLNFKEPENSISEMGEWHPNQMPEYYAQMTSGETLAEYNFVLGKSFSQRKERNY